MVTLCRYYTNNLRLAAGISSFSEEGRFRFFCMDGSITKVKSQFKVTTPTVTVYVTCVSRETNKTLAVVLTSNKKYKNFDNKPINLSDIETSEIHFTLCHLLAEKCSMSGNPFTLEFAGDGEVLQVSGVPVKKLTGDKKNYEVSLQCNMRGPTGEVLLTGDEILRDLLNRPLSTKCFEYSLITQEYEKNIAVRKSRGEILREISHYLGRTVVLVSSDANGQIVEQYISPTSVLEVYTNVEGATFCKKISPVILKKTKPFCIYLTSASTVNIAKEQSRVSNG